MKICGPTPKEAGYAFYVAAAASNFLDAFIEGRVRAEHVRDLSIALNDAAAQTIGTSDFDSRGNDLVETDWEAAVYDAENQRIEVDE